MGEFTDQDRNMLVETNTLLKAHVKTSTKKVDDHEQRIRKVETKQNKILAAFTVISAGVGSSMGAVWHKFIG